MLEQNVFVNRPGHLASVVDLVSSTVIPTKRGQCGHHTVLPNKRETYKVSTKAAKVFPIWVGSGSLCETTDLASLAERGKRWNAVRPAECAEACDQALPPKKRMGTLVPVRS